MKLEIGISKHTDGWHIYINFADRNMESSAFPSREEATRYIDSFVIPLILETVGDKITSISTKQDKEKIC